MKSTFLICFLVIALVFSGFALPASGDVAYADAAPQADWNNCGLSVPYPIPLGETVTFTAKGDRETAVGTVDGETRWVPTTWKITTDAGDSDSGTFTTPPYTIKKSFSKSTAGKFLVNYAREEYSESAGSWSVVHTGNYHSTTIKVAQIIKWDYNGGGYTWSKTIDGVKYGGTEKGPVIWWDFGATYKELPEPPSKSGYVFIGWYTAKTGGTKITADSKTPSGNATLYARWAVAKTIKITYNANGGKVSKKSISKKTGQKYGKLPKPTRSGYTFLGWFMKKSGGDKLESTSVIAKTANHSIYARWAKIVSVKFNANGGKLAKKSQTAKVTQTTAFGKLPTPTRSGYGLLGWFTKKSGGTQITKDSTVTTSVKNGKTYYAHWGKSYKVTFNGNGGKVSPKSKKVIKQQAYGTLPTPTREGWRFDGWFTKKSGGTQIWSSDTVTIKKNQTLYAHWTEGYTVTLDVNVSESERKNAFVYPSTIIVKPGKKYGELPTPYWSRSGNTSHTFLGWTLDGQSVNSDTIVTIKGNHTLKAKWMSISVNINY
jgi:uncharacterized repeat protein (TIGR02543 family)